jgi:catechol 2,3-dioxygenase-like lactoylglutathione lyase family enzyme
MITGIDHVVLLVGDFAAAVDRYRCLLGCDVAWKSRGDGAVSAWFTLGNISVEIMAAEGSGDTAQRIGIAIAAQGEGLASLCFRVDDVEAMHRRLARLALRPEAITEGHSADLVSGAELAWRRTRSATDAAHGVRLFFLQMQTDRPRSSGLQSGALTGLDHVVVATQNPERAAALYGARLGLDMALDRSHPDWGRLMFFRCGDLIVEVVQRPPAGDSATADRLWGLSWRTSDIEATRARLMAAGIQVSAIRDGRKPGTRVMSLSSGTFGVPTLILQPAPPLHVATQKGG